jgi:hypothetical protein
MSRHGFAPQTYLQVYVVCNVLPWVPCEALDLQQGLGPVTQRQDAVRRGAQPGVAGIHPQPCLLAQAGQVWVDLLEQVNCELLVVDAILLRL